MVRTAAMLRVSRHRALGHSSFEMPRKRGPSR
jgi:hypothetical protein